MMIKNSEKKTPSTKPGLITGQIKLTAKGSGYLDFEDESSLEITPEFLNTALDGDTVQVAKLGRDFGKVVEILARAKTKFVGRLDQEGDVWFLKPDSNRFYTRIKLLTPLPKETKVDDKAVVEMEAWANPETEPTGKLLRLLGPAGKHETEIQSIIADREISTNFTTKVEEEAEQLKKTSSQAMIEEAKKRRDFREILTFTIDPVDAKDFDDALSFRKLEDGLCEIGIHIADVTHYVKPNTALDEEAARRATSIYLVDRTIPMLPEILSNDLCSLVPRQDRLAFSAVITINDRAEVQATWFGKTIINSDQRFSYEQVQEILDKQEGLFAAELLILNKIAEELDHKKVSHGALVFDTDETRFELDQEGRPVSAYRKERLAAHKLVEDFMLLANRLVAEHISKISKNKEGIFVYRVHDAPDPDKINNFVDLLKIFGYKIQKKDQELSAQDLNKFLKSIEGQPEEQLINRSAIRTMSKAFYSTKNIGHFGLAFHDYTHFTSPIRRYPDMMVHRLLEIYLEGKKPSEEMLKKYDDLCFHSSEMERRAAEAERESIKYKQSEYLAAHIGETYEGIISGLAKWGVYVEELSTGAEGLVKMKDLGNDYFVFDEKKFAIIGERTKKTFRLGDQVKVKVLAANPLARTIDFGLI